ncbi:2-octaprenyl-6-methoxyphenol hydroxylase [Andreprevotia lacus DSM 23236]|uniref:2-octaprenyl-6-methoxyphenol hydroxylase n=1 Tax=Andreprevotia lacus DSM 23236 TaxID=1121001 RepID=A0A1W1Y1X0_9NEIS|nr:FAD-dependent monooxygenase [Andreprevotia lacus]SMC29791.1 2-octaprenyl-6-methoxyphenol hydroxylase [Andreprevotia lacus DSM 23236]
MIVPRLPVHVGIVVVGGGPVGAMLAQRLHAAGQRVLVVEARTEAPADPRTLALSWASRDTLLQAGLWSDTLDATPIERVHVSQAGTLGRTELTAAELGLPVLGFAVGYAGLAAHGLAQLKQGPVPLALGHTVTGLRRLDRYAEVILHGPDGEQAITADLVVLADGGKLVATLDDITQTVKSYEQHAVLARLTPRQPHQGIAYERFADDGPLALLPSGDDYMLIWTQTPEQAAERLDMDDEAFMSAVEARLGGRIAGFERVGPRASWPLALKTLDHVVGRRIVLVGNAAQTLHPVAGQGLNLGLRDADTLATLLANTPATRTGDAATLARYAQLRRRDAGRVTFFTDSLIHLFESPNPLLKHARSLGLLALDHLAPLRRGFARRMVYGAR